MCRMVFQLQLLLVVLLVPLQKVQDVILPLADVCGFQDVDDHVRHQFQLLDAALLFNQLCSGDQGLRFLVFPPPRRDLH